MVDIEMKSFMTHCPEVSPTVTVMKKLITRRTTYPIGDQMDNTHNNLYSLEDKDIDLEVKSIKLGGVFWLIFSVCSFLCDFGSDIYLMLIYYNQGDITWFILTLVFVFLPSFIMSLFSVIWYWIDKESRFSYLGWIVRLGFHLLHLAPLVRYVDTLIYAWKSKYAKTDWDKFRYYKLMIFEEADSSLLRVIECSMESTPQLLLQLYILFTQPPVKDRSVVIIQVVSSFLSLISLSWCLTSYQSSLRLTAPDKVEMKCGSMTIMVIWKLLVILPRFLSISLFTSVYTLYILIMLGFHYLLMASYIIAQKTTYFSARHFTLKEIIFNLVMAAIYCVDFLNLTEGSTRFKYIFYYFVSFVEITTLIIFWYFNSPFNELGLNLKYNVSISSSNGSYPLKSNFYYQDWSIPIRTLVFFGTIICFLNGIGIMIIYFLACHPTHNIKLFRKTRISKSISMIPAGDSSALHVDHKFSSDITHVQSEESTFDLPNS